jgi:hypothetical protein
MGREIKEREEPRARGEYENEVEKRTERACKTES